MTNIVLLNGMPCVVKTEQSSDTRLNRVCKEGTHTGVLDAFLLSKGVQPSTFYSMEQPLSLLSDLVKEPYTCQYTVQQNIDRLLSLGSGVDINTLTRIKKPLVVGLSEMTWEEQPHVHQRPSKFPSGMQTFYKNGLSLVKSSSRLLLNTFTQWDGELWVSQCLVVDTDRWEVTDSITNGLLNGLYRSMYSPNESLEHLVNDCVQEAEMYPWVWKDMTPVDQVYRPATDSQGRAMLIEIGTNRHSTFNHLDYIPN